MTIKGQVRVIKRDQRQPQDARKKKHSTKKNTQQTARDMVATVTEWVNEFQQRRCNETAQAIQTLLSDHTTRPKESS